MVVAMTMVMVLVMVAGAGSCCWMAAWRGGAERGSALGMRCLKSHRCQTAGQTAGWWPSERATQLRHGGAMSVSPAAARWGPSPLSPKAAHQQNPPRRHSMADTTCNPVGPIHAKSCEVSAGISNIERYFLEICACEVQCVKPHVASNSQCLCFLEPQMGLGVQQTGCG